MMKRLTVTGSTLRSRDLAFKTALAKAVRHELWPALARRQITPLIHHIFPLADASSAHTMMESSAHIGKIVLNTE